VGEVCPDPWTSNLPAAEVPEPHPFGAADAYREVVRTLRESLEAEDIAAARPLLRDLIGSILLKNSVLR